MPFLEWRHSAYRDGAELPILSHAPRRREGRQRSDHGGAGPAAAGRAAALVPGRELLHARHAESLPRGAGGRGAPTGVGCAPWPRPARSWRTRRRVSVTSGPRGGGTPRRGRRGDEPDGPQAADSVSVAPRLAARRGARPVGRDGVRVGRAHPGRPNRRQRQRRRSAQVRAALPRNHAARSGADLRIDHARCVRRRDDRNRVGRWAMRRTTASCPAASTRQRRAGTSPSSAMRRAILPSSAARTALATTSTSRGQRAPSGSWQNSGISRSDFAGRRTSACSLLARRTGSSRTSSRWPTFRPPCLRGIALSCGDVARSGIWESYFKNFQHSQSGDAVGRVELSASARLAAPRACSRSARQGSVDAVCRSPADSPFRPRARDPLRRTTASRRCRWEPLAGAFCATGDATGVASRGFGSAPSTLRRASPSDSCTAP